MKSAKLACLRETLVQQPSTKKDPCPWKEKSLLTKKSSSAIIKWPPVRKLKGKMIRVHALVQKFFVLIVQKILLCVYVSGECIFCLGTSYPPRRFTVLHAFVYCCDKTFLKYKAYLRVCWMGENNKEKVDCIISNMI